MSKEVQRLGSVADHFVYLSLSIPAHGDQIWTRPLGISVAQGEILVALDSQDERHLLIPMEVQDFIPDASSQGVALLTRTLETDQGLKQFLDLHCRVPELNQVFERLVEDIVSRLESDPSDPEATCRETLNDWRLLLQKKKGYLSGKALIGLVGELEVLELLAEGFPHRAIESWVGPLGDMHDFVRAGRALEVKTSTSHEGDSVAIANAYQLDPGLKSDLQLIAVHIVADPLGTTIDQRITRLQQMGVHPVELLSRLGQLGYAYGAEDGSEERYSVQSIRAWHVGEDFPGVRASDLGEERLRGIKDLKYTLQLSAAPKRLSDSAFEALMRSWLEV